MILFGATISDVLENLIGEAKGVGILLLVVVAFYVGLPLLKAMKVGPIVLLLGMTFLLGFLIVDTRGAIDVIRDTWRDVTP